MAANLLLLWAAVSWHYSSRSDYAALMLLLMYAAVIMHQHRTLTLAHEP